MRSHRRLGTGWLRWIAAVLLAAGLGSGCETLGITEKPPPPPPCPPILVLKDAGALTRYSPGSGRDITDIDFQGEIVNFRGICEYNDERSNVDISLELVFSLLRGPANTDRKAAFDYFVAIPHFHPAPQGKNTFAMSGSFAENSTRLRLFDTIQLKIPLPPRARLEDFTIYLGFQLTREELQENQRRNSPLNR